MTDEGTFSRQDAAPAAPTGDASAAARDTMPGAESAPTPAPAPEQAAAPTPDQINEWKQAYENRAEWQRANTQEAQRIARERDEIRQYKEFADQLQYGYQNDPRVREFVDGFNKLQAGGATGTEPTGGVPQPGQQPGQPSADPVVMQEVSALKAQMEQIQRERDAAWADNAYASAQAEFQKVTGRDWTPQEYMQLRADLARTGSVDPVAQSYWTFRNTFAQAGSTRAQENVAAAQRAAAGAQVEGVAGGDQSQPIDLRTAPPEVRRKMALNAIGGNPDDDSHPWIVKKGEHR